MTDKWADYLISKVRYNDKHTHITHVYVHVDNGDTVGEGTSETRQWVVNKIDSGYTFYTIFKGDDGKWKKGQKWLRTVSTVLITLLLDLMVHPRIT